MKKYILIFISVLVSFPLYSQQESIKRLDLKSPEVSAFEKYGEIPVSTYTGVPNISIPIYKVRSGDIELPITLDYHATAIKVDQEATWVGLNWLLNAGGVLSTQVLKSTNNLQLTDLQKFFEETAFRRLGSAEPALLNHFYYKIAGSHETASVSDYGYTLFPNNDINSTQLRRVALLELVKGGEAKQYNASFMGYNFEFIYHPTQQKYIITGKDQKFKINGTSSNVTSIVDPNGVIYYFEATEVYNPSGTGDAAPYTSIPVSYYLTRIVSPSGKTITLRYKNYGYIVPLIKATDMAYSGYRGYAEGYVERRLTSEYTTVNQYLYEIESDDALVRFNVGSRVDMKGTPKKLENIEIFDKLSSNKLIKRFVFSYDYYTGISTGGEYISDYYKYMASYFNRTYDPSEVKFTSDQINKRLRLISVQEYSFNDSNVATASTPYKFSYNSSSLPGKTSAAKDYWGNYNGKENSGSKYYHTLLPDPSHLGENSATGYPAAFSNTVAKADNRFNPATVTTGLISQIIYPTGGSNTFSFEPHRVSNYPYSLSSTTEIWPTTSTLQIWKSNYDKSIPYVDWLTQKDFRLTQATNVSISADFVKTLNYT